MTRTPRLAAAGKSSRGGRPLFAVCAPGLEPYTAGELSALGLAGTVVPGGVEFEGDLEGLYRANLLLRTASRVLARVGEFYAAAFSELRKKAGRLPWEDYLQPGQPVSVRATSHKSRLYHTGGVAERVMGAIGDRLGQVPPPAPARPADEAPEPDAAPETDSALPADGTPAALITVRLVRDLCTLSIDTSGELLHRRGYRLATTKAPLRETLAAGMLLAAGWDSATPLLDPFCGSGTIAIEAALLAAGSAPGLARRFAFMAWPGFDATLWQRLLDMAEAGRCAGPFPLVLGSDRDAGAIEAARANAARAGVGHIAHFEQRTISALAAPPGPGWVVTNPPYGPRLGGQRRAADSGPDVRNLYAQFGKVLRAQCPDWHVACLTGDPRLPHAAGLAFDAARTVHLVNGGLAVQLVQGYVR